MEAFAHDCNVGDPIKPWRRDGELADSQDSASKCGEMPLTSSGELQHASDEACEELGAPLSDWVLVEDPGLDEMRMVPYMGDDDDCQGLGSAAATAAVSGVAGLLVLGPVAGAVIAAGTVGACAEPGELGRLSAAARETVRWVRRDPSGSIAKCAEAASVLAGRAAEAYGEVRRVPDILRPGLASVCSTLSGSALAERDSCIQRLQRELAASNEEAFEEKARLNRELARAEEQQRCNAELEAATLAKDEEVDRLVKELETTERVWQQDTARLTRELEHHRHERLAETKRLTHELAQAAKDKEAELASLQGALAEAELSKALEAKERGRTEKALEAALRQNEEESESKRCCVCFEADRQMLFLPCRHVCCCKSCAEAVQTCPMDRIPITQKIDFILA